MQLIVVGGVTTTEVQSEPPTVTRAPVKKPVPVRVTEVPPSVEPELGFMAETVGAG